MTRQELADLSDARMALNNTLPDSETHATFSRILDSWQEKDRRLECICAASHDLLESASEAMERYGCGKDKCDTPECPRGFMCAAYQLKKSVRQLRACMECR